RIDIDLKAIVQAQTTVSTAVELATRVRQKADLLPRILARLTAVLPFAVVIVIDQAEEIFTHLQGSEATATLRALADATTGDYKVIVSLRTEYYGRLIDALRLSRRRPDAIREYLLTDFGHADLVDAIKRPTVDHPIAYASEIPRNKWGFTYADGLA